MQRRSFIKKSTFASIYIWIPKNKNLFSKDLVIGHNDFRYKVLKGWGNLSSQNIPVNDCHEMVMDKRKRLILLTNDIRNNFIYYDKSGKCLKSFGTSYPGAHGLTYADLGGEEFLIITDTELNIVSICDISGNEIKRIHCPLELNAYSESRQFKPTETAVDSNGDIYVADGYGQQMILKFNFNGDLLQAFGGVGKDDGFFYNAHGIAIDNRNGKERLMVSARSKNELVTFSKEGKFLDKVELPGAYICRPVLDQDNIYLATIWTADGLPNTGVITILDKNNKVISIPGGHSPKMQSSIGFLIKQKLQIFKHPHDVCVDDDQNLYIPQWNAGKIYPTKLIRV